MTEQDQVAPSMRMQSSMYPSIFSKQAVDDDNLDADIVVIGAGIDGSFIAYHASSTIFQARVLVLEQLDFDERNTSQVIDHFVQNHRGYSCGGPRRIGTIGGDDRTRKAWEMWHELNN